MTVPELKIAENAADALRPAPESAVVLYRDAFRLYGPLCLWSIREMPSPTVSDILDTAARLKREGNMASRRHAVRLEEACLAAL